jgi:hypothetical protein
VVVRVSDRVSERVSEEASGRHQCDSTM